MLQTSMNRRGALKLAGAAAIAALPAANLIEQAAAGRAWCYRDPLFLIGDYLFDVSLASYDTMLTTATGPVKIKLLIPPGLPVKTLYQDNGFGYGYKLTIVEKPNYKIGNKAMKVGVHVYAPSTDSTLPVQVKASALSSSVFITSTITEGTANTWINWAGKIETVTLQKLFASW